jgi:uncharacterized protein
MILFDVNILVYAHREDQAVHSYYRERLESVVCGGASFGLTPLVAGGFVRMVTNPKFPNGPTPLAQALSVVDAFMTCPNANWMMPGPRHWAVMSSLCRTTSSAGKAVSDAQHAAIAIEHACVWVSRDKDFNAFTSLGLQFECWETGTS